MDLNANTSPFELTMAISTWGSQSNSGFFSSFPYYFFCFRSMVTSFSFSICSDRIVLNLMELMTSRGTIIAPLTSSNPSYVFSVNSFCRVEYSEIPFSTLNKEIACGYCGLLGMNSVSRNYLSLMLSWL